MKAYYVKYRMHQFGEVKGVDFLARTKSDAYDKAVYEIIPTQNDGRMPYSAWVYSVTYNNGNHRVFDTDESRPY